MTEAAAFAPGNISGVFKIIPDDDPAKMHSLGLGFTVREGVTLTLREASQTTVLFNGEALDFAPVRHVLDQVAPGLFFTVSIETPLPLSSGFGLSGASSLAAAHAANRLIGGDHSAHSLAMIAHVSEVTHLTGLGDVCAQYHGGCLVKLVAGDPLAAETMPVASEVPIFYRYFSAISTREILSSDQRRQRINQAADAALAELGRIRRLPSLDLADPIRVSRDFAENSGLLEHDGVRASLAEVDAAGGTASMIMLGNAVFSTVPFAGSTETALSSRAAEAL